jgi:hypothetical protein
VAKVHLDRLKKRYGWTGKNYRKLMSRIVAENSQSIEGSVGRLTEAHFRAQTKKLKKVWGYPANLPHIEEVIPGPDVFIRKGAERGKLLTDSLRDQLAQNLRDAMTKFRTKTGLPGYLYRRGKLKSQMDPRLIKSFRARIYHTFKKYNQIDPEIGIPSNIKAIAITETRSVVDDVKHRYFERLLEYNPKMRARKRWIHHPSFSKEPRPGHAAMNGKEIDLDDLFEVPVYVKEGGRWIRTGEITLMAHPHDAHGEAEDVINCHCEAVYFARMATRKRKGTA